MKKKCAIVLGGKNVNSTGLIRSLGCAGFEVTFASRSSRIESKYTSHYLQLPDDTDKWFPVLRDYIVEQDVVAIFPSDDESAFFLDENYTVLSDIALVPHAKGRLRHLADKTEMAVLACNAGLLVPKYKLISCALWEESYFGGAVILKPYAGFAGSKGDIRICHNEMEYREAMQMYSAKGYSHVMQQELLDDPDQYEVGIIGLALPDGRVMLPGMIHKIRSYPTGRGSTSYARFEKRILVNEEQLTSFVRATGYIGLFDIEMIICGEKAWFIEVNYRNGQYGHIATVAGYNLPSIWFQGMLGEQISEPKEIKEITYMNERDDFLHVKAGEIPFWQWLKEFRGAEAHGMYCKGDQRPYIRQYIKIPDRIVIKVKKLIKKIKDCVIREEWNVAIRSIDGPMLYEEEGMKRAFQLIPNSLRYWCADPFVISVGATDYLFFEMFDRIKGRGVIGYRVIDAKGKIGKMRLAYESEHHLSFPFVFEHQGDYYMMPESSGDRNLTLLKAKRFPDRWEKVCVWFENQQICDSVIFSKGDDLYLLAQPVEQPYTHAKLDLYKYLDKKWVACDSNPVVNDRSIARMAGAVIDKCGKLIRPSQDCKTYGDAVNFNEIISVSGDGYRESLIRKVLANEILIDNSREVFCGVHTYNNSTRYEVIDVKKNSHPKFIYLLSVFNRNS